VGVVSLGPLLGQRVGLEQLSSLSAALPRTPSSSALSPAGLICDLRQGLRTVDWHPSPSLIVSPQRGAPFFSLCLGHSSAYPRSTLLSGRQDHVPAMCEILDGSLWPWGWDRVQTH
jgi:hypothetical protein